MKRVLAAIDPPTALGIRGARAPASLKPESPKYKRQTDMRIRGARAPASLKLCVVGGVLYASNEASGARAPRPH